jgi:hypothetical protein
VGIDVRRVHWFAAAVTACVLALPAMAAGPDAAAARAFVQKLYSHYPQKGEPYFEPTDKNAAEVFDPGMIAAFREDSRLAKGEVGFVDGDPICQCQDDGGMKSKIVAVTMQGTAKADVLVSLLFEGGKPNPVTLHLVVVNGQWRIYDITASEEPSYRTALLKANQDAAKGQH